jgi:hypothetical protein
VGAIGYQPASVAPLEPVKNLLIELVGRAECRLAKKPERRGEGDEVLLRGEQKNAEGAGRE